MTHIRPAQSDDAAAAALLLYSAYTHKQIAFSLENRPEHTWIEHLENYFRQDNNRFSYQNTQIAEKDAKVAGLVLSFGGRDEAQLNANLGSWLEQEAQADEWYIDALAVFSNWGRQGIGTRLLQQAEQLAQQHGYSKIALNVAQDNEPAFNLYKHLNYVVTGQTTLYQRPYFRMVKILGIEKR